MKLIPSLAILLVALQSHTVLVAAQDSNGFIDILVKLGIAIIGSAKCIPFPGATDRCACRNINAVVNSYNPPKALKGPRLVFNGFPDPAFGTVCTGGLSGNPILSGETGGLSVGNSDGTIFTGVEGTAYWRMWSDDGKYDLGCDLSVYMDNPFVTGNVMNVGTRGDGCSKAPMNGPADFQSGYNIKTEMGPLISGNTDGGAEVYAYWANTKNSDRKRRTLMDTKPEPENPCEDEDFLGLGISPYKHHTIRTHAIIRADELGRESIADYEKNNCRPVYYPKFGKTCQRQVDDEWWEYQYSATARFVCNNGTVLPDAEIEYATYAFGRH